MDFVRARYLSASEAAWRILRYDIGSLFQFKHSRSTFLASVTDNSVVNSSTGSTLLHYFARPRSAEFRNPKYAKFCATYLLDKYAEILLPNGHCEEPAN